MSNEELEAQRTRLRKHLEGILEASENIHDELKDVPHKRGRAHRSLKPKGREYITEGKGSINAYIRNKEGDLYEIKIYPVQQ